MAEWFYAKDGAQKGPVNADELKRLVNSGEVAPSSLVWKQGMAQWTAYSQVAELNASQQFSASPSAAASSVPGSAAQPEVLTSTMSSSATLPNNPMALAGFIIGIVSVVFCCCGLTAIVGLILSIVAKGQVDKAPGAYGNTWMVKAGIIINAAVIALSIISVILNLIFGVGMSAFDFQEMLRELESSGSAP